MAWYNASWSNRVKVTVLATKVDADLTDFPVYVDLSDLPAGFHTNVNQTDGRDIRVTKADGTTEVPREVVSYDSSNDKGELHFKASNATLKDSTNVDFYIYYGNSSATEPARDATYGMENTWDSNYLLVAHLSENPSSSSPQINDSTSNENHATSSGTMVTADLVSAQIGNGLDFDGTDDVLTTGSNIGISGADARTVSCWAKQPTAANENITGFGSTGGGLMFDSLFHTNKFILHAYGGGFDNIPNAPSYTANTMAYLINTYDGTNARTYVNGAGGTATAMTLNTTDSALKIGAGYYSTYNYFTGIIDEVRVSSSVRTVAWGTTEYNNQSSPSTFFTIGAEESAGSVSPSVSPSASPSLSPSISPSLSLSLSPSISVSLSPSLSPSLSISLSPSLSISLSPSLSPSVSPSVSLSPSLSPSLSISLSPSISLSLSPSISPGWENYTRGDYAILPSDASSLETNYSAQDYIDVATKNDVRVEQTGILEYMLHQFKNYVAETNKAALEWEGQSDLAPNLSTVYLQIYNVNTPGWENIDSNNSANANIDFTLLGNIPNLTNYKDSNDLVSCRIYQEAL